MGLFEALLSVASLVMSATTVMPSSAPVPLPPAPRMHGVWPIQPPNVTRGFEPPSLTWAAGHRGVDLAGAIGAPVVASVGGTVTFAGLVAGRGVVVVSHGDSRTTYEPVIAEVGRTDVVAAGDRLGMLDVTQSHCFPVACLHWGWIRGTEYLDPTQLVETAHRIRLLPLTPADGLGDRPS